MKRSTKIRIFRQGASLLFCPAALQLSRQTLTYTAGIIRRHRKQIGSPRRRLNPGQQALLVPASMRKGEPSAELAAGSGIGTASAWRYVPRRQAYWPPVRQNCARRWPTPRSQGMPTW